jgi:hypothetical protein
MDPPTVDLPVLASNLPENSQGVTDNMTNGKRKKFRDNLDIVSNGKLLVPGNFTGADFMLPLTGANVSVCPQWVQQNCST